MKIYASLLTLCAFQLWETIAFSVPGPKNLKPSFALNSLSEAASWNMASISPVVRIEGETRKTFQFGDPDREDVQVALSSTGRPIFCDVEVWIGPDWTPMTLKIHSEDGQKRPVQTVIGTRKKMANVEVRNTGPYEFSLSAACAYAKPPVMGVRDKIPQAIAGKYVEGGAVHSVALPSDINQVQVLLNTDTRQLNAKIELLNGPNNIKQHFEVFTNNGLLNSLYVVFNCPGGGNTIRVRNMAPLEFPCAVYVPEAS